MENSFNSLNLLKPLNPDEIQQYIKTGDFVIVKYNKNMIIHFEGEPCTKTELIISGKIAVERIDESGGLLAVCEFINDDLLGGNLIFSKNAIYPLTVTAKKDCVILEIKKSVLFNLFIQNPEFLRTFLEYISDHTFLLGDKIKHYVNRTIRESIVSFLDYESKVQNSRTIILDITKTMLAEKIGVQRTSLSRELSKMKLERLIDYDARSITIKY